MAENRFVEAYQGVPPWDIGRAQGAFVKAAGEVRGAVIDLGCGTGEHALFFAKRGHRVVGIDFVEAALERARAKARERGVEATFILQDALKLNGKSERFESGLDCGLFHTFPDAERGMYVKGLSKVIQPGGRLFLLCFSDREPAGAGPRRASEEEIRRAFASGWEVERIEESRLEVVEQYAKMFSEGGPRAWFCVVRRKVGE